MRCSQCTQAMSTASIMTRYCEHCNAPVRFPGRAFLAGPMMNNQAITSDPAALNANVSSFPRVSDPRLADHSWLPVGPAPEDAHGFGVAAGVSGRVWSIDISSSFDGRGTPAMFLGINGGGVWRSVDFTLPSPTWTPLTDLWPDTISVENKIGLSNISALAIDPHHPQIIYAGSGDPPGPGPNSYGTGLLKSVDGGNTWTRHALDPTKTYTPGFSRIFVDPTDATGNTVYASGGFGLNSPLRGSTKVPTREPVGTWRKTECQINSRY